MNLLICTQKVDKKDPILGFFHRWIEEFAKHYKEVYVICLEEGVFDLPKNVRVFSLGKEKVKSRIRYFFKFYILIWKFRRNYDKVFVHMNQIYILLGCLIWFPLKKVLALWYAHGSVTFSLRVAEKIVHHIFTSTSLGFRIPSKKLHIVGQGIDTSIFIPRIEKDISQDINIMTVGRISPVKDIGAIIEAFFIVKKKDQRFVLHIYGNPITSIDKAYERELKKKAAGVEGIYFHGSVTQEDLPRIMQKTHIFINMSKTGSLDKVILEALSCGIPVVTSNEAAQLEFSKEKGIAFCNSSDPKDLASKISNIQLLCEENKWEPLHHLHYAVKTKYSLDTLINKLVNYLNQ